MGRAKRSSSESDGPGGEKRKKQNVKDSNLYKDGSVFVEQLTKNGFVLKNGSSPNELKKDQAIFRQSLERSLKNDLDYPKILDDFVEGFGTYIEDKNRFFRSLVFTVTAADCDEGARAGSQDCLVRQLFSVELIQTRCMHQLLEKLALYDEEKDQIIENGQKVNVPRMVMSQFRWLDRIMDSKEISKKMLDIVEIVSLDIQREMIACLPEVVDDAEHNAIAQDLKKTMENHMRLTIPILDALANLTIKADLLSEIRSAVIRTLPAVEWEDMPVIVKFFMQTVSEEDARQVIDEMRVNLDFDTTALFTEKNSFQKMRSGAGGSGSDAADPVISSVALTLDAIKAGARFQSAVADAWLKSVEAVRSAADHKVVDLFALLILHVIQRKPVESLVRNKVRSGHFTEQLVEKMFAGHAKILCEHAYFTSVRALAEILLRSPEPQVAHFSSVLYTHAFVALNRFCQQEIIGSLMTHVGSGVAAEVDAALRILSQLVQNHTETMATFDILLKGVLDYLDNLTVAQTRRLYAMLALLACRDPEEETRMQAELNILIRKQLSNRAIKYKRMGVIGAVMMIKSMAFYERSQSSSQNHSSLPKETDKQVQGILDMVRSSAQHCVEATALFMDELATVVKSGCLHPDVEQWITEFVTGDFQDDYVVDMQDKPTCDFLPMSGQYNLDDDASTSDDNPPICINLLPLVVKRLRPSTTDRLISPACLSPHFRLLQICEKRASGGKLGEIDALLGCPVFLPDVELYDKMGSMSQQEKHVICESLILAVNWFIEVVNAFATQEDTDYKGKVIQRLQNVTTLLKHLESCLAAAPRFQPPMTNFDVDSKFSAPIVTVVATKKGGGKGRKRKSDESDEATQMPEETQKKEEEKATVDLSLLRHCFRELDPDVFSVLHFNLITKQRLDSNLNTAAETPLQLAPPQLHFLLTDLVAKLQHALLTSTAARRRSFLKQPRLEKRLGFALIDEIPAAQVARRAVKLLPAMCEHLEESSGFFQALLEENDGVMDGPGSFTDEAKLMGSCLHLLLQAVLAILSWNGFLEEDNSSLLREALVTMASRLSDAGVSQAPLSEIVNEAFHYAEKFAETVSTIGACVTLLKLLVVIAAQSGADHVELDRRVGQLADRCLKREYHTLEGAREKGAKYNEHVQQLLTLYFTHSEDVVKAIEVVTQVGVTEHLTDMDSATQSYPTLSKATFTVYFKVMLSELVGHVKQISAGKPSDPAEVKEERLKNWTLAAHTFYVLVNFVKVLDNRLNLAAVLKNGRLFMEVFLRQCMPLLDHMFKRNSESVRALLKNVQGSTRNLQHYCNHSKIKQDTSLTNHVPPLKKCLELFLYRVKAMLTLNKCADAFWLGNLKNRNLQGDELLSQTPQARPGSDSDESSTQDDDDDDSDEGADQANGRNGNDATQDSSDEESSSSSSAVQSYSDAY